MAAEADVDLQAYNKLKAFRDLIQETMDTLSSANGQASLATAARAAASRWDEVDEAFAAVLRDVAQRAWQMPFAQVKPVVTAIVGHLAGQLADVDADLNR